MAGNGNSGRKKDRKQYRDALGKYYPMALKTVVDIMHDDNANAGVRLDAAKFLTNQFLGTAPQSIDTTATVELRPITFVDYATYQELMKAKDVISD